MGRYLVPEFEDAAFGPRASAVHTRLQEELLSGRGSTYVLGAIPVQMEVIAMLRHINSELKVRSSLRQLHETSILVKKIAEPECRGELSTSTRGRPATQAVAVMSQPWRPEISLDCCRHLTQPMKVQEGSHGHGP